MAPAIVLAILVWCLGASPFIAGQVVQVLLTLVVLLALPSPVHRYMFARRAWPLIAFASALVVAGHAASFLLAARTARVSASSSQIPPIALLMMAAMVLPSIGGRGLREGVTAWAFGAAGLGAQRGVAAAVVYGVIAFAASLPGAVALVMARFRRSRRPARTQPPLRGRTAHA